MEGAEPPAPTVQCGFCDSSFISELLRIQHIRQHHSEVLKFSCELCGIKCETKEKVARHVIGKHIKAKKRKSQGNATDLALASEQQPSSKSIVKELSIEARSKAELACLRYALIHGQHKAQLRYAKLQPDLKLGWRKITDLMNKHKLDERFEKQYSSALQSKVRARKKRSVSKAVRSIPESVRNECTQYGVIHGPDEAQWEFTKRYPNHVFPYASVKKWIDAMKFLQTNKSFHGEFVLAMNEVLQKSENLTISDIDGKIKNQVQLYNQNKSETEVIDDKNAVVEWLHIINAQISEKQKADKPNHCTCGNVYKTVEELIKHKPKCWVPESQIRSQRSCRINKSTASECETISDSESNGSSPPNDEMVQVFNFHCTDCGYHTSQKTSFKKHVRTCAKKKNSTDKISLSSKIKSESTSETSCNKAELLTLKNCKKCSFKHITIEGLREHYRVSHNIHYTDEGVEISLLCTTCNDTFITYAGLREHVCGERQVKVTYERIKPRASSSITLGSSSVVVYLCPRCVTRFESMQELKEHHSAKTCTKVKLYAGM